VLIVSEVYWVATDYIRDFAEFNGGLSFLMGTLAVFAAILLSLDYLFDDTSDSSKIISQNKQENFFPKDSTLLPQ
jgi:hypothetical protein